MLLPKFSFSLTTSIVLLLAQQSSAAVDYYISFQPYSGNSLFTNSPSVVKIGSPTQYALSLSGFSFEVEQTLNIGSQSSGAGAGKIAFDSFQISRAVDEFSPTFFQNAASGTAFKKMSVYAVRNSNGNSANAALNPFLTYNFNLVAVRTISYNTSASSNSPIETITFDYGALDMKYLKSNPDGTLISGSPATAGWNRVKNVACTESTCENPSGTKKMFKL